MKLRELEKKYKVKLQKSYEDKSVYQHLKEKGFVSLAKMLKSKDVFRKT